MGIPDWIWLVTGLGLVLWCNLALGADSAIQPGTVIYFVVMFTVGKERVFWYTVSRIVDTGIGVLIALLLTILLPSKYDKENGLSFKTCWSETRYAFQSYMNKNQIFRKKKKSILVQISPRSIKLRGLFIISNRDFFDYLKIIASHALHLPLCIQR